MSARRPARELVELHAQTLYQHDTAGRLISINDRAGSRAPRWFLAWTADVAIWRVRHDVSPGLEARLAAIVAGHPVPGDLGAPPAYLPALRAALVEHGPSTGHGHGHGGPAYAFPDPIAARPGAVVVTGGNAEVLRRWLPEWLPDVTAEPPMTAVLVDGAAVSVCACSRLPGPASEAGVETHAAFRGHGHAATVVAAWAQAMRDRGVIPLYCTDWDNTASQRVAAKLGLVRYAGSLSID